MSYIHHILLLTEWLCSVLIEALKCYSFILETDIQTDRQIYRHTYRHREAARYCMENTKVLKFNVRKNMKELSLTTLMAH